LTREDYRSRDKATRDANTRYADSLSDVVDTIASNPQCRKPAEQLADDLSGRYGPFAVSWRSIGSSTEVVIEGEILSDSGDLIGRSARSLYRDHDGYLVVHNDLLWLEAAARGHGFATAFYDELERYYRRSGVDVITIHAALDDGGYSWAQYGFDWDPRRIAESFTNIRSRIDDLLRNPRVTTADMQQLAKIRDRLDHRDPGQEWPTPNELANLRGDDPELGRKLMRGSSWYGIYPLSEKGYDYGT
jgi:GNAT superfamily N-acetyltransferase